MAGKKHDLEEALSAVKQQRDELKLKMHLAQMEAKEEYDRLSGQVEELAKQYEPVQDAVEEAAGSVFSALLLAADEMKAGFHRVRKALDEADGAGK